MSDPTITPPPDAPSRQQPSTFSARGDAFFAWMVTFSSELVSAVAWFNQKVSAVSSLASTANTAAGNAQTYAGQASSSASSASGSASAASSAASAAGGSATNAATSLSSFRAVYLGEAASDPTTDLNGDPLGGGEFYFNTVAETPKIYSGGQWRTAALDASGALVATNNLSDLQSASQARANLGLSAVASSGAYNDLSGKPNLGSAASADAASFVGQTSQSGAATLPSGTNAQRPGTPAPGSVRFNSDSGAFEGHNGSEWSDLGGAPPQCVQSIKTDTASTSTTTWTDTGLEITISLSDPSSRVKLDAALNTGSSYNIDGPYFRLVRNGVVVGAGDASGSRPQVWTAGPGKGGGVLGSVVGAFVDQPGSTGPHVYKIQWACASGSTAYLNRGERDSTTDPRCVSTLTALEVS